MAASRIEQFVRNFAQNGMKLLLEDPGNVQDLLTLGRAEVLDLIDFAGMKPAGTSYVARDYRPIEADIVLTAPLRRKGRRIQDLLIYILIEHQSEPDELMAFRVLEYVVQIYRAQIREQAQERSSLRGIRLQSVLPVVFYTGTRSWDALGSIADLIAMGERFVRRTPALEPLFINLSGLEPGRLEGQGGFFGQALRLVGRQSAPFGEFRALLEEVVARLEAMPKAQRVRWLELLSYIHALLYHKRDPSEHRPLDEIIEASVRTDKHKEDLMTVRRTIADVLKEEGKKEGKKEGKIEQCRKILLRLLTRRFQEVPAEVEATVKKTADLGQLEEWVDRCAIAKKLADVGISLEPE
jgi:hypothetical protein